MSKSINIIFYIFDFRQDLTCANYSYIHRQLHDKPMATDKTQICLKTKEHIVLPICAIYLQCHSRNMHDLDILHLKLVNANELLQNVKVKLKIYLLI